MLSTATPFTVVLVDLDGTIMDSARGITSTLAYTLRRMGLPVPPPTRLLEFVGPPIMDGFRGRYTTSAHERHSYLSAGPRYARYAAAKGLPNRPEHDE